MALCVRLSTIFVGIEILISENVIFSIQLFIKYGLFFLFLYDPVESNYITQISTCFLVVK